MTKPRCRARRTKSLPKMYALQHEHRTAENARARTTSVNMHCAQLYRQSGREAGRKQVFSGSDGGLGNLGQRHGQGYVSDAIHWFLHKFNVDLVDTLRAFVAAACLMCPATAPLPNPKPALVHWPQQLRGHSPFLMRTSSWMACSRSYQHALLMQKVFHSKLATWQICCQESRVGWTRNEDNLPHWAGAVKMILLIQPSSAAAE